MLPICSHFVDEFVGTVRVLIDAAVVTPPGIPPAGLIRRRARNAGIDPGPAETGAHVRCEVSGEELEHPIHVRREHVNTTGRFERLAEACDLDVRIVVEPLEIEAGLQVELRRKAVGVVQGEPQVVVQVYRAAAVEADVMTPLVEEVEADFLLRADRLGSSRATPSGWAIRSAGSISARRPVSPGWTRSDST